MYIIKKGRLHSREMGAEPGRTEDSACWASPKHHSHLQPPLGLGALLLLRLAHEAESSLPASALAVSTAGGGSSAQFGLALLQGNRRGWQAGVWGSEIRKAGQPHPCPSLHLTRVCRRRSWASPPSAWRSDCSKVPRGRQLLNSNEGQGPRDSTPGPLLSAGASCLPQQGTQCSNVAPPGQEPSPLFPEHAGPNTSGRVVE